MEKDFDFKQIGKRLPYKTPDHFFEDMEEQVWKKVTDKPESEPRRKSYRLPAFIGSLVLAASIALTLVFRPFAADKQPDGLLLVEKAFADLSQEDQTFLLDTYQEDIFMYEPSNY